MRVAIVGSRGVEIKDFTPYLPPDVSEIVSGGARGVDQSARAWAALCGLKIKEFLPDYSRHGRGAPLRRNDLIIDYSDLVVAFWDGKSRGTAYVIERCKKLNKPVKVYMVKK